MIAILDPGPKLSTLQLAAFEGRLGIELPEAYRDFLLETNGGFPTARKFSESSIWYFLEVEPNDWNLDLEGRLEGIKDSIPSGMIPIADDQLGNAVLLGVAADKRGTVWFWDHEEPEKLVRLADNFRDFVDSLT